jgi:hypothetical protein
VDPVRGFRVYGSAAEWAQPRPQGECAGLKESSFG